MERIKKSFILIVAASLVLFIHPAYVVSEAVTARADVELQQVALFKNGLGFFVSEVTVPDNTDSFYVVPFAAASHGTFWVAYPPKVPLESFTAKEVESEKSIEAISIEELLRANVGKRVELSFDDKGESTIRCLLSSFAENRSEPQPNPYGPGMESCRDVPRYIRPPVRASLVIVETDGGEIAIDSQRVRRVKFIDGEAEKTFTRKSKSVQLGVKLRAPAGGEKLTVSYLAKGITWAPSYIIDITDGQKALVSAKAAVINEVCDLNDVTIQLVTGFPHLQFADIVSPLALKENLAQFLQSLVKGESERSVAGGVMSNVMSQSAHVYERPERGTLMPAYGAAEAGKVTEDLFLYPIEKVHLARGEVGYLPLFTESVPYKHVYQWNIPDYVNEEDRYSYRRHREQKREPVEEVWHCLRMENTTKVPWTTAPAETVKEGLILGQDTLNYTPVQGETTLRITQAVSVKAEQTELETARERDALRLYGNHFDLITIEGELSVTNFQSKAIALEITKKLSGRVKSSQPEAKIEKLARGLRRMNGAMKLTWTIELKPGEQKQLGYIYDVYVRR